VVSKWGRGEEVGVFFSVGARSFSWSFNQKREEPLCAKISFSKGLKKKHTHETPPNASGRRFVAGPVLFLVDVLQFRSVYLVNPLLLFSSHLED